MTDPAAMEGMMGMMKGNMAMMIPQTLIMSWINAFFAGFVISMSNATLNVRLKQYRLDADRGLAISEAPISSYDPVQGNVAVWRCDPRSGCAMGLESIMVFLEPIRAAICLYIHTRER